MQLADSSAGERFRACAARELLAWMAYATVECFFLSVVPWIPYTPFASSVPDWRQTALALGACAPGALLLAAVSSLALGLAAGIFPRLGKASLDGSAAAAASLTVVWALAINLAVLRPSGSAIWVRLFVSVALSLGLMLAVRPGERGEKLLLFLNPWALSLLLLGLPWLSGGVLRGKPAAVSTAVTVACVAAIALGTWLIWRLAGRSSREQRAWLQAGVAILTIGGSVYLGWQGGFAGWRNESRKGGPPNVILIVLDTVRADHLSAYGYGRETTPKLKNFAGQSTLYSMAIAPSDITLSSHASLFTGLYATRHGARLAAPGERGPLWRSALGAAALSDSFHTLAEILAGNGYRTIGVAANKYFLASGFGLNRGFQHYSAPLTPTFLPAVPFFYLRAALAQAEAAFLERRKDANSHYFCRRAAEINREVFPLLAQAARRPEPFFLFINYMDAHEPTHPPAPYDRLFPGRFEGQSVSGSIQHFFSRRTDVNALEAALSDEDRNDFVSQYDGGIAYVDYHLGRLFARIDRLGLREDTMVIVTSDHGQAFGEKNLIGHGGLGTYQELVHVPLIIRYPHSTKREVVNRTASLVDVTPTILDVARIGIPKEMQGRSLIRPDDGNQPAVISESYPGYKWPGVNRKRFSRVERAILQGEEKFIDSTAGKREFYDLANDPKEERNLDKADSRAARLEARLEEWIKANPPARPAPAKVDKETLDRLKSLGYVQ